MRPRILPLSAASFYLSVYAVRCDVADHAREHDAIRRRRPSALSKCSSKQLRRAASLPSSRKWILGLQIMEITRDVMLSNLIFPKITMEPSPESICISEVGEKIDPADFRISERLAIEGGTGSAKLLSSPN
jgi:hypothetical protein